MSQALENFRSVLKRRCEDLLSHANVVATGIGYKVSNGETTDQLSIICSVIEKKSPAKLAPGEMIPQTVDGVVTDVIETGKFNALQDPKGKFRPAPGGVSIGHVDITAGTLGCLVRRNGETVILSNNHVLANSNEASVGDPILQPGPVDGGRHPQDQIATLLDFVPIIFPGDPGGGGDNGGGDGGGGDDGGGGCGGGSCIGGSAAIINSVSKLFGSKNRVRTVSTQMTDNLVDAAIARPLNAADVEDTILDIGPIQGSASGTLGMSIKKSGRTTEFTTGEIQQIDVTVEVSYGAGLVARFTDQLLSGPISQGGDSGSAILNDNDQLVGLLFAGSSTSTIMNRIENVFAALNVTL